MSFKSLETCGNGITDTATRSATTATRTTARAATATAATRTPTAPSARCARRMAARPTASRTRPAATASRTSARSATTATRPGGCEDDCQHGVGCGNGVLDPGRAVRRRQHDRHRRLHQRTARSTCAATASWTRRASRTTRPAIRARTASRSRPRAATSTARRRPAATARSTPLQARRHSHGEQCDLGTGDNGDDKACTANCQINVCGDGKRNRRDRGLRSRSGNGTSHAGWLVRFAVPRRALRQRHRRSRRAVRPAHGAHDPRRSDGDRDRATPIARRYRAATARRIDAAGEVCDQGIGSNGSRVPYSATPGATCIRCAADCLTVNNTQGRTVLRRRQHRRRPRSLRSGGGERHALPVRDVVLSAATRRARRSRRRPARRAATA